ncbi:hypothetical protein BB021_17315 [Elizabethkingia ursingii]|uniref:Uncharacterized protein n=1 Tax=Elizabethkingia ursingii TaxID=1756150 RepID=A0ABX3NCZ9_9FLAO|nr:hypothetical protein BB021_17315 [Elizabethkingia ursingii]
MPEIQGFFTIANVVQHPALKKIFLGFYKNSFRFTPIIFPDTPKSCGQKDFGASISMLSIPVLSA